MFLKSYAKIFMDNMICYLEFASKWSNGGRDAPGWAMN